MDATRTPVPAPVPVTFDARSLIIGGRRRLWIGGEMHYARIPRGQWAAVLDRSVALGLNAVASYVFWGWHEPRRDQWDFSDAHDLGAWLRLCHERGLAVLLRAGPYCCAEWNYGGYPAWLRDEPGITIRTWSAPYLARVERWFEHLAAEVRPHLASNGGAVAVVQVENEYNNVAKRYGEDGQRYLRWMVELAKRVGFDVPMLTCEGGTDDAIEGVNGFRIGAERVATHRAAHPASPLLWTELWPGWYDTWGFQRHRRDARHIAAHLLRFLARGGSGWSYYMWHGGTNFGRTAMYLQTTAYSFDGPLDEYGRATRKGAYLARLHAALTARADLLLEGARTVTADGDGVLATWTLGRRILRLEVGTDTARLHDGDDLVFDLDDDWRAAGRTWRDTPWRPAARPTGWRVWAEPLPAASPAPAILADQPLEQLALTGDRSDYCWYSATITTRRVGRHELHLPYAGDHLTVFVDGRPVARSAAPYRENRGPMTVGRARLARAANPLEQAGDNGLSHRFSLRLAPGRHRLDILAAALGLVKGDWQLGDSMEQERKGIWGPVLLDGQGVRGWAMRPGLGGEAQRRAETPLGLPWRAARGRPRGPCWWHATFRASPRLRDGSRDVRLDTTGLGKGLLWVNGHCLGRHWLIPGHGYGADHAWQGAADGVSLDPAGEPTQRWYRIPGEWLAAGDNHLVVFDEQGGYPAALRIEAR